MPVRIKELVIYKGSVTPSGLGVETNVVDIPAQTEVYMVEGYIDLVNLSSGDTILPKEYISADEVNIRQYAINKYSNVQEDKIVRYHTKTTKGGYRVTVTQTKGTLRAIPYWFVREQMEVV